ncbi:lasso peptide biosynthesis B2 protein [uncultured Massilia sp.]|uniref:lasso peptide biosynthesis B2 protein n=1 Tax=uncultured Massilia sp. TaxID=169973 RepID=UPI0025FBB862|nr:lasso peptide biosynthesis B2 protein [uncultured Massilia sp.]
MATPGEHLLWRAMGDLVYVLNIRDGRYAGLSGSEAERWVRGFGAARITRPAPVHRPPAPGWWGASRHVLAWQANRRVRQVLARAGFHALYALAEGSAPAAPSAVPSAAPSAAPSATPCTAAAALAAFLRAELLFRNKNPDRDCLVRSFSLYLYLRGLGFPATHRIGIVPYPFDAHAWVELDGKPVLERRTSMERWHVISQLGQ